MASLVTNAGVFNTLARTLPQASRGHVGVAAPALQTLFGHHRSFGTSQYVLNPPKTTADLKTSQDYMAEEERSNAHNYAPLPVVLSRGKGAKLWDVEGREYLDFISSYAAVNQGHCHPKIVGALVNQAEKLTLTSRAFYNDGLALFSSKLTEMFGYDKILPANTGVEAGEAAVKLIRKWGYEVKGIEKNKAEVIFAENNFWGRSIAAVSSSSDPVCYTNFGPFTPGFPLVPYNDVDALSDYLDKNGKNVAGVYLEPIQGEAGVVVPDQDYFKKVRALCDKHNVLLCSDEVQAGLCRAGTMLAIHQFGVRPDLVCLGKALSGGVFPVSCVLGDNEVLGLLKPGMHGSTYGGNPVACRVAMAALDVLVDENLAERSQKLGEMFRETAGDLVNKYEWVKEVRGRGCMNAIELYPGVSTLDVCISMRDKGLLSKPTQETSMRFAPPLVMTDEEMQHGLGIIKSTFAEFDAKRSGDTFAAK
eukprot:Clim_evm11s33 gene=Clim_evmTU11s33